MANKRKGKPQNESQDSSPQIPKVVDDAAPEDAMDNDGEPPQRTMLGQVRFAVLNALGMLGAEELAQEEAAQRLREAKEEEERAYEALPWIAKCGRFRSAVALPP